MKPVKVIIVETTQIMIDGLRLFLNDEKYEVPLILKSLEDLKSIQPDAKPDLVIASIKLKLHASLSYHEQLLSYQKGLEDIKSYLPDTRIAVLLSQDAFLFINNPYEWNIDGYILHENAKEAFLNYLNLILIGEKVIPSISVCMLNGNGNNHYYRQEHTNPILHRPHVMLSERERDIIGYLEKGDSNKNIANKLNITESTVKVHIKTILRKLGVHNRTQVALWAVHQHTKIDPNNLSGICMIATLCTSFLAI